MRALLVSILVLMVAGPSVARGEDVYEWVLRKQEKKQQSRWSISDWIETRDKMRLMDLWLAIHSPSPYEFYLGGEYLLNNPSGGGANAAGFNGHLAAYASIFGLEAQYTNLSAQERYWQALFLLRLFGLQAQGTNITLQGGLRSELSGVRQSSRNPMVGVSMNLYLARFFGLEGLFQSRFEGTPNSSGNRYGGTDWGAGAFIDFKFLRLYGQYHWLNDFTYAPGGGAPTEAPSGQINVGARLYF
ncbi:MAG TPA: hypothetical protein VL588_10095 [Bdellovibrionota bacterium]|nr:hypothetical protein [Bdellovibrionota bacterium]